MDLDELSLRENNVQRMQGDNQGHIGSLNESDL